MPSVSRFAFSFCVAAFAFGEGAALADTHACVEAAHEGQSRRDAGKLSSARNAFVLCSADECPAVVRENCQKWGAEIEMRVPSIVLAARDDGGRDLANVRVTIDGRELTRSLDGRSVPIDPGPHDIRFEAAGFNEATQSIIVREGEKVRNVLAVLSHASNAPRPKETPAEESKRSSVPLIVSGGVAVLGGAGFAIFGLLGKSERDKMADSCSASQTCSSSDVSSAQAKWIVADVSLGIGIVGAGIFTALLVAPMFKGEASAKASAMSFGAAPIKNGAAGSVLVSF